MDKKVKSSELTDDRFNLIEFAWKKKGILISLTSIAFLVSIFISFQITPRFKSTVILFPAASVSYKNLVETSSITTDNRDVLSFGEDEESERMLQILNSNKIRDHIIKKFNLMHHYNIDSTKAFPKTKLDNKYYNNIKFRRTEFMSIEIKVLDTDPQMAADIANEITAYIDSTIHYMQKERALEAFDIVQKEYLNVQSEIKLINDSLQKIRDLGVIDYESQASALNTAYANAILKGDKFTAENLLRRMKTLSTYGGIYVELSQKLETEILRMSQLKSKFISSKVNVEQSIPQIFILDMAMKAEKKSVPKRSIIVIMATLSTFAFSLLLLIIAERLKS